MDIVNLERKYEVLTRAVLVLKSGGVVVVPTDTVYGLCADARNKKAIAQVFTIKARNLREPLPVLIRDFALLDEVAYVCDKRVRCFLEAVWPGAVTAVLPSRGWMPLELRSGKLTIGVRIPGESFATELLKTFGRPLVGTSANVSGKPECARVEEVAKQFSRMPVPPDFIIDGGVLPGTSSTVVDCTTWPPVILRRGAVPDGKIFSHVKHAEETNPN
ncbi:MAG: threonylcarbamoyl-AMP synthase [Parcubacteria group bacterium]|nr:threonylcarbamoyl-AMP synthase [Parcubacteria group bacterium]